jgi:hypothetical protein
MSDEKEDFGNWIICGVGSEIFVGKPRVNRVPECVSANMTLTEKSEAAEVTRKTADLGHPMWLFPCYKFSTINVNAPQQDSMGRVVGINVQVVEQVASPTGVPADIEIEVVAQWKTRWPLRPGYKEDEAIKAHIMRLVKLGKDAQEAARAAAAGIATGRMRM